MTDSKDAPVYAINDDAYVKVRKRVNELWRAHGCKPVKKGGYILTERAVAEYYGVTQPLINHLRKRQKMNKQHVKMFAEIFDVPQYTIFPEMFEGVDLATPDEARERHFSEGFAKCPKFIQDAILLLMQPYSPDKNQQG